MVAGKSGALSARRKRAVESFRTAAECIGKVEKGSALFAVTRGQFSMIDAILAVLDQVGGPSRVSVWTWTVAEYEIQCLERLRKDQRLEAGLMVIDHGARVKNLGLIRQWKSSFGPESVRYVLNHSKIATVEGGGLKVLLRGSMNLNWNPRFEQFDLTEGGEDFELVQRLEQSFPILQDDASGAQCYDATGLKQAWKTEDLKPFQGVRVWGK